MSLELRRAVTYASQVGWLTQLWCVPSNAGGGVRVEQTSSVVACVSGRAQARECVGPARARLRRGRASPARRTSNISTAIAAGTPPTHRRLRRHLRASVFETRYLRDAPSGCAMDISLVLDVLVYAPNELIQARRAVFSHVCPARKSSPRPSKVPRGVAEGYFAQVEGYFVWGDAYTGRRRRQMVRLLSLQLSGALFVLRRGQALVNGRVLIKARHSACSRRRRGASSRDIFVVVSPSLFLE